MTEQNLHSPGPIILFGSGETLPPSGRAHEFVAERIGVQRKVVILETPAGFEPNSSAVAGSVGKFISKRLQNYQLEIRVLPARKKGTAYSPDDPDLLAEMLSADWIFMGPGSPTYAVRQLEDSLALRYLVALQRLNVPISLASAAVLAISAWTLPVYEIYKVGEDLHWKRGLNLLGSYGLECIFIPHWNNSDGGEELDTSRCYMGQDRFSQLMALLPQPGIPIIGIDEHTALVLDFENDCGCVSGKGSVTVIYNQHEHRFSTGKNFSLNLLGNYHIPEVSEIIAPDLQTRILTRGDRKTGIVMPDEAVMDLVEQREAARNRRDWAAADRLREEIETAGWQLRDTPEGPDLHPKNGNSAL